MANIVRTKDSAAIPKSKIITDFSLAAFTPILVWGEEGTGQRINLVLQRTSQTFNNTPVTGIVTTRERYVIVPGTDIYGAYFTSVPAAKFDRASVEFAPNTVIVRLNQEA